MTLEEIANNFAICAKNNGIILTTAESCTAGLISATVAMISGSSAWLESGFVVYTPEAKARTLGVKLNTIEIFNITSCEVAKEMAQGAMSNSNANLSIAVTGVAGPNGGTKEIPVGTVAMSWILKTKNNTVTVAHKKIFSGTRNEIREKVVIHVLQEAIKLIEEHKKFL